MISRSDTASGLTAAVLGAAVILAWAARASAEPQPSAPTPPTLSDCVREALAANPDLSAARSRAAGAAQSARAARGARLPQVVGWSSYVASDRPQRLAQPTLQGEPLRYETDLFESILETRMPLFDGGRLAGRQHAAQAAQATAEASAEAVRQDLLLSVTATYLRALERQSVVEAAEASLRALEGALDTARAMEDVGRIPPLDRLKVEVRVAALRQRLSQAVRDRRLVLLHLGSLLGRPPDDPVAAVAPADIPARVAPVPAEPAADAASRRPEVRALEHEANRRRHELAAASGERWPVLDAAARYTLRSVAGSGSGSDSSLDRNVGFATGMVTLRVPLFTGGQTGARIAEARAALDEADARLAAARLRAAEEVAQAAALVEEARERQRVAEAAVGQAEEAYGVETANYELGRGTVNDVLDAEAALFDARSDRAAARFDAGIGEVERERAEGRDLAAFLLGPERNEP